MAERISTYTLQEIAAWDEEQKVSLPTVQRGFVWKPNQIENLWDSLLRGYPVGAFVLSSAENNSFHILDGQQRATAICLGFAKETFRDSQDYYKVFIDVELPKADDSRKFIFRVITRSHPWGYRKQENNKTLTADNIRKAMDLYEDVNDPLITPLDNFFPYDAGLPVPFHFFIEAALTRQHEMNLYSRIQKEYEHWDKVKKKWKEAYNEVIQHKTPENLDRLILEKIKFIHGIACEMLDAKDGQRIPALYMNLDKMMQDHQPKDAVSSTEDADEVENLFVRLNSGGTPLSGEELNYSILKAHLQRAVQDEIENACKQLFKPARFITIAFRLFQQEIKEAQQTDALTMRIKPKQFQRTISKQATAFETFILLLIREKRYEGKSLLEYIQSILEYNTINKQDYGLPFLLYSKIADTAPELMFLLLYRIKIKHDRFSAANAQAQKQHRSMLGMLTLFIWFGRGENLKDHAKLLANIWPAASTLDGPEFWSAETIERAYLNDVLLPFPSYAGNKDEDGLVAMLEYNFTEKAKFIDKFCAPSGYEYRPFMQKAMYHRDIILYSQRHFIETYFKQQQFRLEDSSLPFDWDHISPDNLVRNKKNIPPIVREWYQTIGNFRAWPYALNRMDSDNSPACKFNPLEYWKDDKSRVNELEKKWLKFIKANPGMIEELDEIPAKLTEWSFCEPLWKNNCVNNIKTDWRKVTKLIVERNISLIREWYQELNIEILRKEIRIGIDNIFDKRKWAKLPLYTEDFDNEFDVELNNNRISSEFIISNARLNFYFSYPDGINGHLEEDSIQFGLFEVVGNNYLSKMKPSDDFEIDNVNHKWIGGKFSLVSSSQKSYISLLNGLSSWLRNLPVNKTDIEALITQLKDSVSAKFKSYIV